jgi:molybdopterin molybdotransferase
MLQLEEAVARILAAIPAPGPERVPLSEAFGRFAARALSTPIDLPVFSNSSVDGYALRSADIASASQPSPVRLRLAGRLAAGDAPGASVNAGECVRVFTGSPIPQGADAVVMQEDTRVDASDPAHISVLCSASRGENIRERGEDVRSGSRLVGEGDRLTAGRLALLAAVGCGQVEAARRPVVGLLATGSELREAGQALRPGEIYESNRAALAGLVRAAGGEARVYPLVPDTLPATRDALQSAIEACDLVVTSGGVSVGEMDFVKGAFLEIGGSLDYWKVAVKPGRPFVFGQKGNKLLFGLPGNPISALVTYLLLVRPAILRFQGARDLALPSFDAPLAGPLVNAGPRRHFMRVALRPDGAVVSAGLQGSHALSSAAAADGLVDVPPDTTLGAGTKVRVLRWD